jgi:hypothetical protein
MRSSKRWRSHLILTIIIALLLVSILLAFLEDGGVDAAPQVQKPSTVSSGEEFQVAIETESDEAVMEVVYPGARLSWLFEPGDEIASGWSFDLTAPYAGNNLTIRFLEWKERNGSSVLEALTNWLKIEVTGWIDEDGDGLSDIWEQLHELETDDPNDDEDEDGVILLEEMYHLTDPEKVDTDDDSMDDIWEITNGTLPFIYDTNSDPDRDSWSNIQEKLHDTDPRDPMDHPEEPPATPWYWILLIFLVLFVILGYFVKQLFSKRKLDDDLEEIDKWASRERSRSEGDNSGKI